MQTGEYSAYEKFMRTGRVEDYLSYAKLRAMPAQGMEYMGMDVKGAYNNGRDCPAGATHGRL